MVRRVVIIVVALAIAYILINVVFCLGYWFSGGGDYRIPLPRGYYLVRTSSEHVALCTPVSSGTSKVIVSARIDGYAVLSDIVVGHVSQSDSRWARSVPGYFILDTRSGTVRQGLSKQDWVNLLHSYGLRNEPELRRPTRPLFSI